MKKILVLGVLLSFVFTTRANEGIQFSEGTWKEILSMAKKENKLVFIDVFTSWCGPCKMMSAEIFPKKEVGTLFNASFVNYKIDAEKGEGIDIAKKFNVRAFPTYLFVNGDGQLIYRTTGYMPAPAFLKEAQIAINEKNDPKPLVVWEDEYNSGKRDKEFLLGYLKKRALVKLPSPEIDDEVFPMLTKEELADKDIMATLLFPDPNFQIIPKGKLFNYVIQNYERLDSQKIVRYPLGILESGIRTYFQKNIIPERKEKMISVTQSAYKEILEAAKVDPAQVKVQLKELPVQYYSSTKNEAKLNAAALDLVNNGIMKLDISAMQKSDKEKFKEFMEPYLKGEKDSLTDQAFAMKRLMEHNDMTSPSYSLRSAAEAIYNVSKNRKMLLTATQWAKTASEWFPHFSSQAVYAGLLFKTGQKQKAISMMEVASKDSFLKNALEMKKLLEANVQKLKEGKAPTNLWNVNRSN